MDRALNHLLESGGGIIRPKDVEAAGMSRSEMYRLVANGELERIAPGQYVLADDMYDELYAIQQRSKLLIYSHETALYLHELTDRTPFIYMATIPSASKVSEVIRERCQIFYINRAFHELGLMEVNSKMGHMVKVYDVERTICDIIRSRSRLDEQIVLDAVKRYAVLETKNLNRLYDYAKKLRVKNILLKYMEVLL